MLKRSLVVSVAALALARTAQAQCPDGTPPPCRAAAPVVARRPAPPLDDKTWIVLPFDNVAHATDIDWLSGASVNLLYLDLSKWRDIRVIDDERVADYMREVPEARAGSIGLQAGIAVARRAGAGKLVMGDLLKLGTTTRVVAKVFDVRTGQRLRSVQQEASNADSLMPIFGRLARGILNAEPPAGSAGATIGTTSLGAYQEYVAGVAALSSWDLDGARGHFEHALQLDTTFALAHYKLSVVWGWQSGSAPQRISHAEAASRFSSGLPARERTLIAGQLAQAHGAWGDACENYLSLVHADSTDVEAWYNVGECSYHDPAVIAVGGDTAHLAFRGNWNTALKAFRKTLELDPTYHLAFAHIPDILQADRRAGCLDLTNSNCTNTTHLAFVIRRGDSLVVTPISALDAAGQSAQALAALQSGTRAANSALARDLAAEWVAAGPQEPRAHRALGRALLHLGDLEGADRELKQAGAGGTRIERIQYSQDQMEIAIKLGRYADAHAIFDAGAASADSMHDVNVAIQAGLAGVPFGKLNRLDAALRGAVPAPALPFVTVAIRTIAGVPPDSAEAIVAAYAAFIDRQPAAATGGQRGRDVYGPLVLWGARWARQWRSLPPLDSNAAHDPRTRITIMAIQNGPGARAALTRFDSVTATIPVDAPDGGSTLLSAEAHLLLGDTAGAYARMLDFDRRFQYSQMFEAMTAGLAFGCFIWNRGYSLLGDLAVAQGHPDVAARAYRRVVGMLDGADPDAQPMLAHARAALQALPGQ